MNTIFTFLVLDYAVSVKDLFLLSLFTFPLHVFPDMQSVLYLVHIT